MVAWVWAIRGMIVATGFYWDEQTFWHSGGHYALTVPVGGLVQPPSGDGYPDTPESKRRMKNLLDMTGLLAELDVRSANHAKLEDLSLVHSSSYLGTFKSLSEKGGGELGPRAPFGWGGYEIATKSAGLAKRGLADVLSGDLENAYVLTRPPGHHCLPEFPNGFCLLANIAIAIESARAAGQLKRALVIDWDVHHGNGTEGIFYDRDDVMTISLHQERNYPLDTGDVADLGHGAGHGYNLNIPLPPGAGHVSYIEAMERLVVPAVEWFKPDVIIIACGFDAAAVDPLSRMMATAETFREMTRIVKQLATDLCGGKLVLVHEGGYSEVYVPFCGHATIEELSGTKIEAEDPLAEALSKRQPNERFNGFVSEVITDIETFVRDHT